jgi:hypothetical protein
MSEAPLPRPPRKARPPTANLDELFGFDEDPLGPSVREGPRPWVVRSALHSFALSAVVYTAFHIVNLGPPYPLILAMCAGAVLVRRAVGATAEPQWQRTRDAVRPPAAMRRIEPGGWFAGGDGMLDAVRRWDRRLDWGAGGRPRFDATVAPRLGELADERLRLRHSLTRASDPGRARDLLGDEVWALLHGQGEQVPSPREIAAVVTRLEAL